ncbi:glycoside hydrolase family 2 protein [Nonomuraea mesophila]|uniref:beta-mannosidase n=1 Tax=Nonomuraea mesophila TaxID=2530382 RepID=A0A4R5FHE1_9ACTN|nr:glycoside hydrolase family 2 protein [Nonomuraea mesophila]TDE50205.1 glycoside hydrolase family 2 protein [Nonomuraea mesophila]
MSSYRPLHDGWFLSAVPGGPADVPAPVTTGSVPATVPGCVHTDLLAAALIDDPYLGDNEERLAWIGRTAWVYRTSFAWSPDEHERTDLVCEGLDTVATVELNGVRLAATANEHRSYRFPVRHLLREGGNTLTVRFDSAYDYAGERRAALGERPASYAEPYMFVRKTACNFGWDWGPTVVTAGISRPIGLESWSGARLAEVRPIAHADGRVEVHVRVERVTEEPVTVTAEVAGVRAGQQVDGRAAVLALRVPDPEPWWPRGYGGQPLHDLTVRLGRQEWRGRIGFRSVELDREAFRVRVNGVPVFVRGVNWIPDDCFAPRITRERLAERFGQAIAAGVNLLRVWGGGRYESDAFYDLADELGLLVWQDFPFACAAYPEEEPFRSEVEAEARQNVARLAPHPSLVLWCGNNENLEGHADWGWRERLEGRSWGAGFYHDLLPSIVAELDPTRPYWPGSPYSGAPGLPPNDPSAGTVHIWDVWNREDYTRYAAYRPRFVAEFGFQGPPAYATVRRASSDEPLTPGSSHQKAVDGHAKLLRGLGEHLPAPETFDDWHYLTQLNQARAMAFGIERFRALMPYCMGTIVWQLNDCWPVTSWSAVDGDGRLKPLWYALRRAYADRLLSVQDGALAVVNDSGEPWSGDLRFVRRRLTGEPLAKEVVAVRAAPRSVLRVALPGSVATPDDPAGELLTAELDAEPGTVRTTHCYAEDTAMAFPEAVYDARAERVPGGYRVTVTAGSVLRELALFPDRLDPGAAVDDQLVTLLPGERAVFHVTTDRELDTGALTRFPVLRCVNERAPAGRAQRSLPARSQVM